jgi:hypothetical protein
MPVDSSDYCTDQILGTFKLAGQGSQEFSRVGTLGRRCSWSRAHHGTVPVPVPVPGCLVLISWLETFRRDTEKLGHNYRCLGLRRCLTIISKLQ